MKNEIGDESSKHNTKVTEILLEDWSQTTVAAQLGLKTSVNFKETKSCSMTMRDWGSAGDPVKTTLRTERDTA